MPRFLIHHRHESADCGVVFASFQGFDSPLRHRSTASSCRRGGHEIWWSVEAADAAEALGFLPYYVGRRASVTRIDDIQIP